MTPLGVASLADPYELRETHLFSYGFEPAFGIAWMRRVKTQVAWHLEQFTYFDGTSVDPRDRRRRPTASARRRRAGPPASVAPR